MLKKLIIHFQSIDDLFSEVTSAIESGEGSTDSYNSLNFDSLETYKSYMTSNKAEILSAISKLRPESVYKLAQHLNRRPQHVTADCNSLESHGFIKLIKEESGRRQIRPELVFDYDVIFAESGEAMPILVSEKSERVLAEAAGFSRAM